MIKPLPCPFCGALHADVVEGDTFRWLAVMCGYCAARGPDVRVQTCGDGDPAEWKAEGDRKAIEAWNDRFRGAAMTTPPLSPAAQAVLDAHFKLNDRCNPTISQEIAAALRAVATFCVKDGSDFWRLIAIANELGPQP